MSNNNFNFNLKSADISNLSDVDVKEIGLALTAFYNSKGFNIFMDFLKNKYVSDAIIANRGMITDQYFLGGFDMIDTIESFVRETALFEEEDSKNKDLIREEVKEIKEEVNNIYNQ